MNPLTIGSAIVVFDPRGQNLCTRRMGYAYFARHLLSLGLGSQETEKTERLPTGDLERCKVACAIDYIDVYPNPKGVLRLMMILKCIGRGVCVAMGFCVLY